MPDQVAEIIGAIQDEAEFEAVIKELGTSGIDRRQISVLAQDKIARSCAKSVGCDVSRLPHAEIDVWDDRQQLRVLLTSLAATAASFVGAGAVLAVSGDAASAAFVAATTGGGAGGLAAFFGHRHEVKTHEWAARQLVNGGILIIVYPVNAAQRESALKIFHSHCGQDVVSLSGPTPG